ncbi:hypothetical protein L2E82_11384 [Cichorium intybus]|uniref:Uncharacterized protein n=1 Tax=Cichorium intybus TaxID=13427 RepID=A0ACB9GDS5_CICIN|nr:hypothetical protein L2E82_11384 [Cichorium intybus]
MPQVARSHEYPNFISQCCRKFPPGFNASTFWSTIGEGYYNRFDRFEGHIRSPAHRMLHRLVVTAFAPRSEVTRILEADLYFMWIMIARKRTCDLPYMIIAYLHRIANCKKPDSPIYGGHFITRLARSYGLGSEEVLEQFERVPVFLLQQGDLVTMGVLRLEDGRAVLVEPHIPQGGWVEASDPDSDPEEEEVPPPAIISSEVQGLRAEVGGLRKLIEDQREYMYWMGECMEQMMARSNVQPRRPPPNREPEDVDSNI